MNHSRNFCESEMGGGPSSSGTYIFILLVACIIYFGIVYGPAFYKDYMLENEIVDTLGYDRFKILKKPSTDEIRKQIVTIGKKWGASFPEQSGYSDQTFLEVEEDGAFFKAEYRYSRQIKHLVGQPKTKWFHHKVILNSNTK
ncbi:hypothetical protein JXQ70_02765 [bacterium]|nr:hypothetical protein [bacterium]